MRVSTYSRQFHAEHESINADQAVSAFRSHFVAEDRVHGLESQRCIAISGRHYSYHVGLPD